MASLRGLRGYKRVEVGCCGRKRLEPIPASVIRAATQHPEFLSDMRVWKAKLGVERLIISVDGCRTIV